MQKYSSYFLTYHEVLPLHKDPLSKPNKHLTKTETEPSQSSEKSKSLVPMLSTPYSLPNFRLTFIYRCFYLHAHIQSLNFPKRFIAVNSSLVQWLSFHKIYQFINFQHFLQGIYWIGVTDIAVEGDWIFASDSSYVNSSYWHSTEPSGKPLENCVVMRDTFMGYWDDVLCSTEAGFVCEKIDTCECLFTHVGFHYYRLRVHH